MKEIKRELERRRINFLDKNFFCQFPIPDSLFIRRLQNPSYKESMMNHKNKMKEKLNVTRIIILMYETCYLEMERYNSSSRDKSQD